MDKFQLFDKWVREIHDLEKAVSVLEWDLHVNMPEKGGEDRSRQIATLSRLVHEKKTGPVLGELLEDLEDDLPNYPSESYEYCLIKKIRREYDRNVKVPPTLVSALARAKSDAHQKWVEAKTAADFAAFSPYLSTIVNLKKQYAECFKPYDHIYDVFLDGFEPGLKTEQIKDIFSILRREQVELVRTIEACAQVENGFLTGRFDTGQQLEFSKWVIGKFGFDWRRGRLDLSAHPFQTTFGANDARITTRVNPKSLKTAIFGTFHESGHAIYEMGIDDTLSGTPLYDGASSAVHESQSRLWENIVGRSYAFWEYMYPRLQERFPRQLADIDLESFYRGVNRVSPSCIRLEADEITYNLHIMLRMEIEVLLFEENLDINDLPGVWNAKMSEYLGVTPKSDAEGVLQDIHWSVGEFGYFPSYALGNVIAAQVWEKIGAAVPDLKSHIRNGEFQPLRQWLRENLHRHGAKYEPADLLRRVTGEGINPRAYLRYLKEKYSRIYDF